MLVMLKLVLLTAGQLALAYCNDNHEGRTYVLMTGYKFEVFLMISDHDAHIPSMFSSMLQESCGCSGLSGSDIC